MIVNAATIQFDVLAAQVDHNMKKAEQLVAQAAAQGAELILLPELWNTGYALESLAHLAEDSRGPAVELLRTLAAQYRTTIVGGSIAEAKHGQVYNTSFVLGPKGQIITKYRKVHLFTYYMKEHLYFTAGDELASFALTKDGESVNVGLCICYDLRFPEIFRNLALRGAKLFCVPTAWPAPRLREYELFCRARAAENRAFVLAANYTDTADGVYAGGGLIAAPDGETLIRGENYEGVYQARMDFDSYRDSIFNSLADRQPFIDEIDDNLL